MEIIFYAVL